MDDVLKEAEVRDKGAGIEGRDAHSNGSAVAPQMDEVHENDLEEGEVEDAHIPNRKNVELLTDGVEGVRNHWPITSKVAKNSNRHCSQMDLSRRNRYHSRMQRRQFSHLVYQVHLVFLLAMVCLDQHHPMLVQTQAWLIQCSPR